MFFKVHISPWKLFKAAPLRVHAVCGESSEMQKMGQCHVPHSIVDKRRFTFASLLELVLNWT